jgi:sugar/nucleoside kinase (ribokinase family)
LKRYDLFGIGTPVIDYLARVDDDLIKREGFVKEATNYVSRERLDALKEQLSSSILRAWPGDNARNVCEGVSFMGGRTAYAGRIGKDPSGKMFDEVLRRLGIESFLEVGHGRTGEILTLITPDLRRTFVADLGNGEEYGSVPEDGIGRSRFLFLTSITLLKGKIADAALKAVSFAADSGVSISISLESAPMIAENRTRLLPVVLRSALLFGNEEEISALTGESPRRGAEMLARGGPTVCVKLGERGSVIVTKDRSIEVRSFPARVMDPTGAGDFYAAGFISGITRGKDLEECGEMGSRLASMVIENLGATLTDTGESNI